jgi:hypothetical protein
MAIYLACFMSTGLALATAALAFHVVSSTTDHLAGFVAGVFAALLVVALSWVPYLLATLRLFGWPQPKYAPPLNQEECTYGRRRLIRVSAGGDYRPADREESLALDDAQSDG